MTAIPAVANLFLGLLLLAGARGDDGPLQFVLVPAQVSFLVGGPKPLTLVVRNLGERDLAIRRGGKLSYARIEVRGTDGRALPSPVAAVVPWGEEIMVPHHGNAELEYDINEFAVFSAPGAYEVSVPGMQVGEPGIGMDRWVTVVTTAVPCALNSLDILQRCRVHLTA
jgi:hypothetical protein